MNAADENRVFLILGEMKGDIKSLLDERVEARKARSKMDYRVVILEKGRWFTLGAAAVIGAVVTPIAQFLIKNN